MNEQQIDRPRRKVLLWIACVMAALVLLAGICAVAIQFLNEFTLELILYGDREITLEYGEHYNDPGANVAFYGTILWRDGVVPTETEFARTGQVDDSKVGTYELVYTARFRDWTASATRTVHIVDTTPPEITLNQVPDHYTLPGKAYQEEGFTAIDTYDGDITDQVTVVEQDGLVTYTVTDSSGNQTQVQREIYYNDPIPPVLTLSGGQTVYVNNGTYEEPGFTAEDNVDGDLTDKVQVSGSVDGSVPGTYKLTYTVTDGYNNTTTVTRDVVVRTKVIYLTFDDGPGAYTDKLLAVLDKYDVKVTFFVIDNGRYDDLKKIAAAGHSIGMHTRTHNYRKIYASEDAFFQEIYALQKIIYEQTGINTTLLRFPGGSSNTVSKFNPGIMSKLTKSVQEAGFQYFDWNVDSFDAGGATSASEVARRVINGCSGENVSVVLQHDIKGFSVSAVEEIIIWGLENGYTFLPLDATSPTAHHRVNN